MAKIGRNEKCPCGSGKKYKRCHGSVENLEQLQAAIIQGQRNAQAIQLQRQRQQGLGKPIISAETDSGHRIVAVKNRLHHSTRWKTFPDFLGDYIKTTLGAEWGNAELAKPPEVRHPILNWYQKVCANQKSSIAEPGKVSESPMTGAVAAYMHSPFPLQITLSV